METWREIDGFSNYRVSYDGRVKSLKRKRMLRDTILNTMIIKKDSHATLIDDNGDRHTIYVKKLVAKAFLDYNGSLHRVKKIINDPANNRADNLIIEPKNQGVVALKNTPISILLNFPSTYLAKEYGLSTTVVHNILSRKLEQNRMNNSAVESIQPVVQMEEFESYYRDNSYKIDGSWMNSQERYFINK